MGLLANGLFITGHGLLRALKCLQDQAAVVMNFRQPRPQAQATLVTGQCLFQTFACLQGIASVVVGLCVVGLTLNGLVVTGNRFFKTLQSLQGVALVEMRFSGFGLKGHGPLKMRQGLVQAVQRQQGQAQVGKSRGGLIVQCKGLLNQGHSAFGLLGLKRQQAQQMQSIKMLGLRQQDLFIEGLRARQLPLLMPGKTLLEQRVLRRGRVHVRVWHKGLEFDLKNVAIREADFPRYKTV